MQLHVFSLSWKKKGRKEKATKKHEVWFVLFICFWAWAYLGLTYPIPTVLEENWLFLPHHLSFTDSSLAKGGVCPLPLLYAGIFADLSLCRFGAYCVDNSTIAYVRYPTVTPILQKRTVGYSVDITWQLNDRIWTQRPNVSLLQHICEPHLKIFLFSWLLHPLTKPVFPHLVHEMSTDVP